MKLGEYLFGNSNKQKLAFLLWQENWQGSVRELSQLSGLSYATTYETLQRMEQFDLVKSSLHGRSRVYVSNLDEETKRLVLNLLGHKVDRGVDKRYRSLTELGAPLVEENPEEKGKVLEDLLCQKVAQSKNDATLLRVLPLVLLKTVNQLNLELLLAYSRKHKVTREMGFLLDLTSYLSDSNQFKKWSKRFKDRRRQKGVFYFHRDRDAGPYKQALLDDRTPKLARKWHLKLNMDLASEQKFMEKYLRSAAK